MNGGLLRVFHGANWIEVLVIPTHSLPGFLKGFVFIGRKCRVPEDVAFRCVLSTGGENDAGLAFYDARWQAKDTLYVTNDPVMCMRLQCWHMQDNMEPAPLVSIYAN